MMLRWVAAGLLVLALAAAPSGARVGVEMPAAGDDGGEGIAAAAAIRLGLGPARTVARDSANGGFQNAHRDEGSDNDVDRRLAPAIVAGFAADPGIVAAVGGLRRSVGDVDAAAADAHGLPAIVLARWSPAGRDPSAFCLCVSPPRLAAFARSAARARFGSRLLVVFVGEAARLPERWPGRFAGMATASVTGGPAQMPAAVAAAQRAARAADAVLVVADERPALLWRSAVFRARFDVDYVTVLAHRGSEAVPAGTRRGEVVVVGTALPQSAARRAFARRFHAAAGFVPDDAATRGFAAAQILRGAGTRRAEVRNALRGRRFDTVAGPVAFGADGFWRNAVLIITDS